MGDLLEKKIDKKKSNKYETEWKECEVIPLGGFWAYACGIVEDKEGNVKVRIAKGKVLGKVWREKGELKHKYDNPKKPISQVNRLNIKSKGEWGEVKKLVDKYIENLEKDNAKQW